MEPIKILSIDIGIVNLGYVYCEINLNEILPHQSKYKNLLFNKSYNKERTQKNIRIIDCNRVNITYMRHTKVNYCSCKLHHDNCIPDYLDHFIQETPHFNDADIILLERQPPVGITNVQDLLFKQFREKTLLISPNAVHKYFTLNGDYTIRKTESEKIANVYLTNFAKFTRNDRKHDMSDALLMVLYYYKTRIDSLINSSKVNLTLNLNLNSENIFDKFKFNLV
jgi:hypothetical protein